MNELQWKPVNTSVYECRGGICAICVCTEVEGVPCGDPGDDPKDLDACRNCGRKYQMVIEVLEDPLFKPEVKRSWIPAEEEIRFAHYLRNNFPDETHDLSETPVETGMRLLERLKKAVAP